VYSQKNREGVCSPHFPKALPYLWPKSATDIPYPIYDLTKN